MSSKLKTLNIRDMAELYLDAKRLVLDAGFEAEIAWQENACWAPLTEHRFLSEAAWVVLSSGMKESVVRTVFPAIAAAFAGFSTAGEAAAAAKKGRTKALRVFGHVGKIDAIIAIVAHVNESGLATVRDRLTREGLAYLRTFPYIGPITVYHLAKNLGQDVAKPDRHLVRVARACGYDDPQILCRQLRDYVGEPVPVIDIVLWRFATLVQNYVDIITQGRRSIFRSLTWEPVAKPAVLASTPEKRRGQRALSVSRRHQTQISSP
jgi:hypothetical protein